MEDQKLWQLADEIRAGESSDLLAISEGCQRKGLDLKSANINTLKSGMSK